MVVVALAHISLLRSLQEAYYLPKENAVRKRVVGKLSVDKARMSVVMLGRLRPRWFDLVSC